MRFAALSLSLPLIRVLPDSPAPAMLDIVRDSSFGQIVNWASNGRLLPYRDQLSDYVVPSRYLQQRDSATDKPAGSTLPRTLSDAPTVVSGPTSFGSNDGDLEKHSVPAEVASSQPPSATYPWLVDFEENDPDRPKCVSSPRFPPHTLSPAPSPVLSS